jgi:hypothetical protein
VVFMWPNPLLRTAFDGKPKFHEIEDIKNSARNASVPRSRPPRVQSFFAEVGGISPDKRVSVLTQRAS